MDPAKAKEIFDGIFKDVNGRALSLEGRESQQLSSKSFVYGEAVFDPFSKLLSEVEVKPGQLFLDCGSGTGKAVFVGHLVSGFSKSIGVELLESLYKASEKALEIYNKDYRPQIAKEVEGREIKFILGNILDIDYSTADVVFMNSTCFQEDLMQALIEPVNKMKPGAILITLSKTMNSPAFEQYKQITFEFSWGQGTAFYHRKL